MNQIFTPFQPGSHDTDDCGYIEVFPDVRLTEYIYCYWRLKSLHPLGSPFSYRVIPDGCIDIFFDMNSIEDSRVMGFCTSYTAFDLGRSFDYAGIRFMPAALPYIFNVNASSLTNRDERLHDVVPSFATYLKENAQNQIGFDPIRKALDQYFLTKIQSVKRTVDYRLTNAISIIIKNHGGLNLHSELDTGVSPRQLRRLCEFYIGVSPKMFSKVIRFQYFFQLLKSSPGNGMFNKVLYDAGYYDQPHFNKDFKSFFGLTPSQVFI